MSGRQHICGMRKYSELNIGAALARKKVQGKRMLNYGPKLHLLLIFHKVKRINGKILVCEWGPHSSIARGF